MSEQIDASCFDLLINLNSRFLLLFVCLPPAACRDRESRSNSNRSTAECGDDRLAVAALVADAAHKRQKRSPLVACIAAAKRRAIADLICAQSPSDFRRSARPNRRSASERRRPLEHKSPLLAAGGRLTTGRSPTSKARAAAAREKKALAATTTAAASRLPPRRFSAPNFALASRRRRPLFVRRSPHLTLPGVFCGSAPLAARRPC